MQRRTIDDDFDHIERLHGRLRGVTSELCVIWATPEASTSPPQNHEIITSQRHVVDYPSLMSRRPD